MADAAAGLWQGLLRASGSTAVVGLGVVEGFGFDAGHPPLAGEGFGVAPHLAPHEEGDLVQFRFAVGGPDRRPYSCSADLLKK